jgi:enediyne biosynthesis protein E4
VTVIAEAIRARAKRRGAGLVLAALLLGGCGGDEPASPATSGATSAAPAARASRFHFEDVAARSGVTCVTWCGRPEKPHILESGGSGLALVDVDGDGFLDLYVVNAWRLDGEKVVERGHNVLYRNRGDGRFEDITAKAGVGDDGWGNGVAVGDPNGDGKPDLYVTNFGKSVLYVNRGDGTFDREPDPPGIDGWATGAVFFDADGDGDDDLYVAAYIDAKLDDVLHAKPTLDWKGTKVMFGPFGLEGESNQFFRNDGYGKDQGGGSHGKFALATEAAGLTDVGRYFSFGVAATDLDADGDLDLYVANDSNPNYLYRNQGDGTFEEMGLWSGAALSAEGVGQAGMGVAVGDYDGDGRPDLCVTNFIEDYTALYRNLGKCLFRETSAAAGIAGPTTNVLSWGVAFGDFDLDGDLDLFIANGHIYPQADTTPGSGTTFAQKNQLFENEGGKFRDVSAEAGPGLVVTMSSRGVAIGDIDNDGDLDLVISNVDAPPTVLRNDTVRRGAWLSVYAPGALRAVAEAGGKTIARDVVRGGSYLCASDPRLHFGLGPVEKVDRLTVTWPGGATTVLTDVAANRSIKVERPVGR